MTNMGNFSGKNYIKLEDKIQEIYRHQVVLSSLRAAQLTPNYGEICTSVIAIGRTMKWLYSVIMALRYHI